MNKWVVAFGVFLFFYSVFVLYIGWNWDKTTKAPISPEQAETNRIYYLKHIKGE